LFCFRARAKRKGQKERHQSKEEKKSAAPPEEEERTVAPGIRGKQAPNQHPKRENKATICDGKRDRQKLKPAQKDQAKKSP